MLIRYTQKNKYGGFTWHVKIPPFFNIYIYGSTSGTYVVDFKEFKWIRYKTHFSFVSNDSLEETISASFDKVLDFFKDNKDFAWSHQQKENTLRKTFETLKKYREAGYVD